MVNFDPIILDDTENQKITELSSDSIDSSDEDVEGNSLATYRYNIGLRYRHNQNNDHDPILASTYYTYQRSIDIQYKIHREMKNIQKVKCDKRFGFLESKYFQYAMWVGFLGFWFSGFLFVIYRIGQLSSGNFTLQDAYKIWQHGLSLE